MSSQLIKTISCFSGIGGFSLAAKTLGGFDVAQAIEIDPFRQQVLRKNFPKLPIHNDICSYDGTKEQGKWDLLITTFPCKGMSEAGKRQGYQNKHSALWWESFRLIQECQPKFIIIENVRGFINRGLRECLDGLRMAGYNTEDIEIISARQVGACHRRERIFVVAHSDSFKRGEQPCAWSRQVRGQIEEVRGKYGKDNSRRTQFPPFFQRMDVGVSSWLDGYHRNGWWLENPFAGDISAPRRSIPDRQKRISALGDVVVPQQAIVPLMRVKYLWDFFDFDLQYR